MRLRRETGDFNLVFDWTKEQYTCQIRKGLSAEDLAGVIVTHIVKEDDLPVTTAVVPIIRATKADGGTMIQGYLFDRDGTPRVVMYDPETGIATFRPDV